MRTLTSKRQQFRGIREGYRSGLEDLVAKQLHSLGIKFEYEPKDGKVEYTKPQSKHKYTPDFVFAQFIVETKGRFTTADRKKHKLIKEQHPDIDIRFVFSNSNTRISKQSKTTYAQWCDHYGFKYADKLIPNDWLREIKS
jgi:hypothetical protein